MGKSGIIGKKISATLASTGTPSVFVHPAEAFHGDLGIIEKQDIILAISYSGETEELLRLVPFLKDNGNKIIAMTKSRESSLGKNSDSHISILVEKGACLMNLVPTASTTSTLAMGDAIAVVLMKLRKFKPENFARFHPGGSLGKKLLTKVKDIMQTEDLPFLERGSSNIELISLMSKSRYGFVIIKNNGKLLGIVTDGDLRRGLDRYGEKFLKMKVKEIMSERPLTITGNRGIQEAEKTMKEKKVSCLVVEEEDNCVGVVMLRDVFV
jgi:arabinose-5-phosphate isomerase